MRPMTVSRTSPAFRGAVGALGAIVLLVLVWVPITLPIYQINHLSSAFIMATAVIGLNLLTGFAGQISLGHSAFFGLGAYTTGVLMNKLDWPPALTFPVVIVVCFAVGMALAGPALRLKGLYLALVTLTFAVLFPGLVRRFDTLTGGSFGITGLSFDPPQIGYFVGRVGQARWIYWTALALLAISFLIVANLMRGRMGRAIIALRENETPAIIAGINRAGIRTAVFGISAVITGMAGALSGLKTGILVPDSFGLLVAILLLAGMVLGGRGTHCGPLVGGFAIYYVPEWTSDIGGGHLSGILFGLVMVACAFVMPSGIVGAVRAVFGRLIRMEPNRSWVTTTADAPSATPGERFAGGDEESTSKIW